MVAFYRSGHSLRKIAETFNESKSTIQRWVKFALSQCLTFILLVLEFLSFGLGFVFLTVRRF
jgi:transposase-like protein